jgi:hypothetical protein
MARLRKLAEWLRDDYLDAAGSLLEGMEECFTINRLKVPPSLHRCLATTSLIESSQSGVRMRTRWVWLVCDNARSLGGCHFPRDGKEFPSHQGLHGSLGSESNPAR